MPLTAMVRGVTLKGFEYSLDDATLELGTTRGISNVFVEDDCSIKLSRGKLLVTATHSECCRLHPYTGATWSDRRNHRVFNSTKS